MAQTLYRKWRSQTFGDVVGQKHVTRTLLNALEASRLSHAYLFCGPRGVGKTSVARLLAKAVNCRTSGHGEPCNECDICQAISEGRSLDVIEVDAASNRGIDEIRDLREKVNFAPNDARFKFYILDEAHMLTNEAANALLKTLEEPPAHVVFVLVTTEPHKLPATIISRCQRFDFRRIPLKEIMARLNYICQQEGVSVDSAALELVARLATGSLRDAESLLDQLLAYCGPTVTLEDAQAVLGVTGSASARELVELVIQRDLPAGIRLINDVMADGADLRQFNREVVDYLRGIMVIRVSGDPTGLVDVAPEIAEKMRSQATQLSPEQLVRLIRTFGQADLGLRGPVPAQLPLELAVVEAILSLQQEPGKPSAAPQLPIRQPAARGEQSATAKLREVPGPEPTEAPIARRHRGLGEGSTTPGAGEMRPQSLAMPREVEPPASQDAAEEAKLPSAPATSSVAPPPEAAREAAQEQKAAGEPATISIEQLVERWPRIIAAFGGVDKKIQAILRDAEPGEIVGDCIVLNFAHSFHKDTIEKNSNLVLVEKTLNRLLGGRWRVQCTVGPAQKREQKKLPIDDPLVREAVARGARIKAVRSEGEPAPDI